MAKNKHQSRAVADVSESTVAVLDAPEEVAAAAPVELPPVSIGEPVLYCGAGGVTHAAIATSNQDGTRLSLTAFPPGLQPIPLTGVEAGAAGVAYSWRRRG